MKFYLIPIISILVLATGTATAQHTNFGVKAGLNTYNIESDNNIDYDLKTGLYVGLLGHMHLNDKFAFQPELVLSMQGAESTNTDIKLDYINIPLLLQYMFDNGFRIGGGPQLGLLLNAKADTDVSDDFKAIDIGLSIGSSYIHTQSGFGFEARFNLGLSDISENSNLKSTNRGLQIGVFYLFGHRD